MTAPAQGDSSGRKSLPPTRPNPATLNLPRIVSAQVELVGVGRRARLRGRVTVAVRREEGGIELRDMAV